MAVYGYMRVSTAKRNEDGDFIQTFDLQRDALIAAGVQTAHIFEDRASGAKASRPGLEGLMKVVGRDDEILVWKLDRLGRNARNLLDVAEDCRTRGVSIRSLQDGVDTRGSIGQFLLTILAAVAELERENISERVTAGIAASVRAGGRIGRKRSMNKSARLDAVEAVTRGESISSIARRNGVSRASVYRVLQDSTGLGRPKLMIST